MPDTDMPRRGSPSATRLVLTLALCQFTALMDRSLLAALVTPIKASLGLTDAQIGLLQGTGFAVLYALAIVPAGSLADRITRQRLLLLGLSVWSLGVLGYVLAPGFEWLFAASLLVGLGQAVVLPCSLSLIAERVVTPHRARANSVLTSAGVAGRAVALIGGGWLLGALGGTAGLPMTPWRAVILTSLAVNLMAFLALVTGRATDPVLVASRTTPTPTPSPTLRDALCWIAANRSAYVILLVLLSATILTIQGVAAWTPTLLHRRFALDPATASLWAGCITVLAGVAGHAVGGFAVDAAIRAMGLRGAFINSAAALALACPGVLLFTQAADIGVSLAGLVLFAFAMGMATPTGLTLLQGVTTIPAKGTVSGLMLAATILCGLGFGPLLIGLASDRGSAAGDGLASAVVTIVLPVMVVGITAALAGTRLRSGQTKSR
ncbi:MFS transporter [Aureimonas phyllosphaerae]|uniref:Putative MFS family arabinose efflux permease n=1 Tax=Aureimonas phyllosphaerae TaxID=1166078 RepID=A0A7W6BXM6_9HYPH|nr:MFS transporter [Aureimonas phyllosphaerae]MBB3937974.1 putative MFS family arabinose efflux permease [Aureimonas phyllosphaerae]MBB3961981.1 putative MFS family arabinose efflux permease [Aureimonas phyllosphaerae]SFF52788.1 Predicted arabinose efflux permease, MFS family [Aureimonas phyllosphaerae]